MLIVLQTFSPWITASFYHLFRKHLSKQSRIMKQILFTIAMLLSICSSSIGQNTPEELGNSFIQSFIDKDQTSFNQLIPTCDEIISYIKAIKLPLSEAEMSSFETNCPTMTESFKNVFVNNYKKGVQSGIVWKDVVIDEVAAVSTKADEFEFNITTVNIVAHYNDRMIEISIKNAFSVDGKWKVDDKVVFSF